MFSSVENCSYCSVLLKITYIARAWDKIKSDTENLDKQKGIKSLPQTLIF